ncbi:MAG: hypothetical protein ACLQBY_08880 [Solirubrobacteraceae bacterium]
MASRPPARSVKISEDERTGWSSDRPRRDGAPPRPVDLTVHCRVLAPADRLRYSPGSLLVVLSASPTERDRFLDRLIEDRACLLSLGKVRALLAGRVGEQELQARAEELLRVAVSKRLDSRETVVLAVDGLDAGEREPFVRMAAALKRPRHLILLETAREQVREEDHAALNELRRALDAGELGGEGFQTALRLGGGTAGEVKRILFRPPPREDS